MQHQPQMSCKTPDASACLLQATSLAVLLPQDAAGELGLLSKAVAAPPGRCVTRAQLLRCIADFYAAELSREALVAAMQVRYTSTQLHSSRDDAIGCTSLLLRCIAVCYAASCRMRRSSRRCRRARFSDTVTCVCICEHAVRFSCTWSV